MHVGHVPHVVANLVLLGGSVDVLLRAGRIAEGFVVQAQVQVGIEQPRVEFGGEGEPARAASSTSPGSACPAYSE